MVLEEQLLKQEPQLALQRIQQPLVLLRHEKEHPIAQGAWAMYPPSAIARTHRAPRAHSRDARAISAVAFETCFRLFRVSFPLLCNVQFWEVFHDFSYYINISTPHNCSKHTHTHTLIAKRLALYRSTATTTPAVGATAGKLRQQ